MFNLFNLFLEGVSTWWTTGLRNYAPVLLTICLSQWLYFRLRTKQFSKDVTVAQQTVEESNERLAAVQRDRTMNRLENHILREFVSQTDLEKSIALLLRRFVPNQRNGFSALIQFVGNRASIIQSRGLSEESRMTFQVDPVLYRCLCKEQFICLEGRALFESTLLKNLTCGDRGKASQLHLVAGNENEQVRYVLMTTELYPAGGSATQQKELAKRLMSSVCESFRRLDDFQQQQQELESINERLELRSIAEQEFDSPVEMLQKFLLRLQQMLNIDRIALYLAQRTEDEERIALCRCGNDLQPSAKIRWQTHEQNIIDIGLKQNQKNEQIRQFDRNRLSVSGIDTLISRALVIPLKQENNTIAHLCCTAISTEKFTNAEIHLAEWTGDYLAKTIQRWASLKSIERQAKRDRLTNLANRHEFDQRIEHELTLSAATKKACSLLLFDLDHFKAVNDTHGHQAGDYVLQEISKILQDCLSQIDGSDRFLAARYGGEELAVLLPGVSETKAARIAELVRQNIETTAFPFGNISIAITVSVGIATSQSGSLEAGELIGATDAALYASKESGRNRVTRATEMTMRLR